MKKSLVTVAKYLFFLGLGILFVWLSVREIDGKQWDEIKAALQWARLWLILPVVAMLLLSHFSRAVRWKILMEPLGYRPSTFNVFSAVMIGYLVNSGVPRLGEVVKCTLLSRYEKVRADKLIGTIVMERAVDVVCLAVVFLLALIFQGHVIGGFVSSLFGTFFQNKAGEFSIAKLSLYGAGVLAIILVLFFIIKRFAHVDAIGKLKAVFIGIWDGLLSIRQLKRKGWFVVHTILIWSMYWLSTTLGIYALQETAFMGMGGALTTLAVGSVGMIVTPGGIGAYPVFVSQLAMAYGTTQAIGTTLGWLLWSVQTAIVIFGGAVLIPIFTYVNKNKRPSEARTRLTEKDIAPI